jgi:hypothetical protein
MPSAISGTRKFISTHKLLDEHKAWRMAKQISSKNASALGRRKLLLRCGSPRAMTYSYRKETMGSKSTIRFEDILCADGRKVVAKICSIAVPIPTMNQQLDFEWIVGKRK